MVVRSSGVSAVLFSAILLAACGSSTSNRVVITPTPTSTATSTPSAIPASTPTPASAPTHRPAATPTPPFWGQLGGTGGDTFVGLTGVPHGASCEARTFGEPPNSNIVLTAPWNSDNASGKFQITWNKGGKPPSNIVWPSKDKMVWPSPSPPGSAPRAVTLHWKTRCTRQGFTSAWVAIPGSFTFGPPS